MTDSAPTNLTPSGFWGGVANTPGGYSQASEDARRDQDFRMAGHAREIGARFEEVRILADRLLRDLEAMPSPDEVAKVTGASVYEARIFAAALYDTVQAARNATASIRDEVVTMVQAVHDTLTDLSNADASAHAILTNTNTHTQELIQQQTESGVADQNVDTVTNSQDGSDQATASSSSWPA